MSQRASAAAYSSCRAARDRNVVSHAHRTSARRPHTRLRAMSAASASSPRTSFTCRQRTMTHLSPQHAALAHVPHTVEELSILNRVREGEHSHVLEEVVAHRRCAHICAQVVPHASMWRKVLRVEGRSDAHGRARTVTGWTFVGRFLGVRSCLSRPSAGAYGACGAAIFFLRLVPRYENIADFSGSPGHLRRGRRVRVDPSGPRLPVKRKAHTLHPATSGCCYWIFYHE